MQLSLQQLLDRFLRRSVIFEPVSQLCQSVFHEMQYDLLAEHFERYLDVEKVANML